MQRVVLDTNVLVSALLTAQGKPSIILSHVLRGSVTPCLDARILSEYEHVLQRDCFAFELNRVDAILSRLSRVGVFVLNPEPQQTKCIDISDQPFYEIARQCDAVLITGNTKHFPTEPHIQTPAQYVKTMQLTV